jgi:hypothetical protein
LVENVEAFLGNREALFLLTPVQFRLGDGEFLPVLRAQFLNFNVAEQHALLAQLRSI